MSKFANGLFVVCALAALTLYVTGANTQTVTTVTLNHGTVPATGLNVELLTLPGITISAEIDIIDFCGTNCTPARFDDGATLIDSDGNMLSSSTETLVLSAGADTPTHLVDSGCQAAVQEVRITYNQGVPVKASTWSAVKALFG
jgi:hypothetical protein